MTPIISLAPDVYLQKHPLGMVGCQMGRTVTVIRLSSGKLVIHSTVDFSAEDVVAIRELGGPEWLLEATNFHDTHAPQGRAAFPDTTYLVPPGFRNAGALNAQQLQPETVIEDWQGELDLIEIGGMPKIREHALYHRASKTLVAADLMFNLPPTVDWWTRSFLRVTAGIKKFPDMSRLFRYCIKDRVAFTESMRQLAELDFERLIVAHGDPIEREAKSQFLETIETAGFVL